MSDDDLESLEILANQSLMEQIRSSSAEIAAGEATVLTKEQARELLGQG